MTEEDKLQIQVTAYLDYKYGKKLLHTHVANERKTSPRQGALLKRKGVKRGVPDTFIFNPIAPYIGLAIENKIGKNKTTKEQKEWLANLDSLGWKTAVCYTLDEAIAVIETYLKGARK